MEEKSKGLDFELYESRLKVKLAYCNLEFFISYLPLC